MALKFTVQARDLRNALARLGTVSSSDSRVYRHCLVRGSRDSVEIVLEDAIGWVSSQLSATDVVPGVACLFAESLFALPSCADGAALAFAVQSNHAAEVQSGKRTFFVAGLPPREHPSHRRESFPIDTLSIPAHKLLFALQATMFAMRASKEIPLALRVHCGEFSLSAYSNVAVARCVQPCSELVGVVDEIVMPARLALDLSRILRLEQPPVDSVVRLRVTDRAVLGQIESSRISCRLPSASVPALDYLLLQEPREFVSQVRAASDETLSALRSVAQMRGPEPSNSVIVQCARGGVHLVSDRTGSPTATSPINGAASSGDALFELDGQLLEAAILAQQSTGIVIEYVRSADVSGVVVRGESTGAQCFLCVRE